MDPEHRDSHEPPKPGPDKASTPPVQQPSSDPPLPSMMKPLPAPATPMVDATAQYPSLEAAVAVEQQVAPTLTNLLATKLQTAPSAGLGSAALATHGITVSATASTMAESEIRPAAVASEQQSQPEEPTPIGKEAIATPPESQAGAAPSENITSDDSSAPISPKTIHQGVASTPMSTSDATELDHHGEASLASEIEPTEETIVSAMSETATSPEIERSAAIEELAPTQPEAASATQAADDTVAASSDAVADEEANFDNVSPGDATRNLAQQVRIKREEGHVAIIFPQEETNANPDVAVDFIDSQIWLDLQQRLSGGTAFDSDTPVHLYTQNSLWDTRQLQELDEALGRFNLTLARIITSRRQTAVAAAMSGYSADQVNHLPELLSKASDRQGGSPTLAEPLYLQTTVRSGTEIRHPGSVVIVGDLNPGSSVIADGDILVWGRLRGIAHAGAAGNKQSTIMALKLEAPQLRIAGAVARVDAQGKGSPVPEIAYVTPQGIRITPAYSFNRHDLPQAESAKS